MYTDTIYHVKNGLQNILSEQPIDKCKCANVKYY